MNKLQAASLFMAFLGMGLSLFLAVVLYPQRRVAPAGPASWLFMLSSGIWHLIGFTVALFPAAFGVPVPGEPVWRAAGYVTLAVSGLLLAILLRLATIHRRPGYFTVTGIALIFAVLPLPLPLLTIGPPFVIACCHFHRQSFGLIVSRRSVFALALGVSAAVYLFLVRLLAAFLESRFGAAGWLIELALLLWAGILWLPLYAAISRFLSRRAEVYAGFGRTVIHEAALVFDIEKRKRYLASQLASSFQLSQVLILDTKDAPELLEYAQTHAGHLFHKPRMQPSAAGAALEHLHCNYFFPLRYEDRITGFLLIDSSPLASLDENDTILAALAPQVSQSLESCRVLEEKITLERELVRQDHLVELGKVAATIAHEVKNPLSTIKTIAQLMREDEAVTAHYTKDLEFIVSEVNRLDQSVRQLLGFSRPAPRLDEEVALSELVQSTVASLTRQAQPLGVTLAASIQPGITLAGGNREMVQQIVLNLVLNAIQASPPRSTVTVILDAMPRLTIEDQGQGIPAGLRERVFEPFFTTRQKGTGLGLAIVRKNARMLGGDVTIECPPEGGTRAIVTWVR